MQGDGLCILKDSINTHSKTAAGGRSVPTSIDATLDLILAVLDHYPGVRREVGRM
jgi:hypothetical protein